MRNTIPGYEFPIIILVTRMTLCLVTLGSWPKHPGSTFPKFGKAPIKRIDKENSLKYVRYYSFFGHQQNQSTSLYCSAYYVSFKLMLNYSVTTD